MTTLTCTSPRHFFTWQGQAEMLEFDGKALDLDDDLAAYLQQEAPSHFTVVAHVADEPAAAETPAAAAESPAAVQATGHDEELPASEMTPPHDEAVKE